MIPTIPTIMAISKATACGGKVHSPEPCPMILAVPEHRQFRATIAYNFSFFVQQEANMALSEQVQKDMVEAMRSRDELRLSTLRMMKSALKNKEIDKRAPLDDRECQQVLST